MTYDNVFKRVAGCSLGKEHTCKKSKFPVHLPHKLIFQRYNFVEKRQEIAEVFNITLKLPEL